MASKNLFCGLSFFLLWITNIRSGYVCKFTNLNCLSFDKSLYEFQTCRIKAVSRTENYVDIIVNMRAVAQQATVRVTLFKRASGWRPFLYNITVDACSFLKSPKSNPVANFFYSIIVSYSNLNHSCPYNHDIYVRKFRILEEDVHLPFPNGEYAVDTVFNVNHKPAVRVNGSCIKVQ